jgi:hypothetical protein
MIAGGVQKVLCSPNRLLDFRRLQHHIDSVITCDASGERLKQPAVVLPIDLGGPREVPAERGVHTRVLAEGQAAGQE